MWQLISRVFMGWSLGSNDVANIFELAGSTKVIVDSPGLLRQMMKPMVKQ